MRLLLDSHVVVWLSTEPMRLSRNSRSAIETAESAYVSPASVYELEYKRLRDPELARLPTDLETAISAQGLTWLPITAAHMQAAARLPRLHGDPWDRILIAQAQVEKLTLVTVDSAIRRYDVPVLW